MRELTFPKHIDEPPTLLLWRLDDMLPVVVGLMLGILASNLFAFLLAGVAAGYGYRRYRESRPDGFVLHWLYWHGLLPLHARSAPNPFARRFAP